MPLCQECQKKQATLHFTKILNGEKTESHLCDNCAREKGEMLPETPNGFSIHKLLSGFLDFQPSSPNTMPPKQQPTRCEHCGLTHNQFSKVGRFGCSSCYKYFDERLDPLFKRVHGNIRHTGKVPRRTGGMIEQKRRIEQLKQQLAACIQQEEFEQAARLRDEIRELEKACGKNEPGKGA